MESRGARARPRRHKQQPPEPHWPCDLIDIDKAQSAEDQNSWPTVGSFRERRRKKNQTAAASLSNHNLLCSYSHLRSRLPCSLKRPRLIHGGRGPPAPSPLLVIVSSPALGPTPLSPCGPAESRLLHTPLIIATG